MQVMASNLHAMCWDLPMPIRPRWIPNTTNPVISLLSEQKGVARPGRDDAAGSLFLRAKPRYPSRASLWLKPASARGIATAMNSTILIGSSWKTWSQAFTGILEEGASLRDRRSQRTSLDAWSPIPSRI